MSAGHERSGRLAVWALLAAVAVTVTTFGVAAGLGTQITTGATETGQGAVVTETGLAYWEWHATLLGTLPTPVPARVSVLVGTPTILPRAARSYTINASVAGQTGIEWIFQQTTAAPRSTEIEIRLSDGLSQPGSMIKVYVETSARALFATAAFTFWWDAGTFAPAALTIESMTASVFVCTAVGNCP